MADSKSDKKAGAASAAAGTSSGGGSTTTGDDKSAERSDGRTKSNQLRAMSAECGLLSRADGSVRYAQAKSSVLVAVYGPLQVTHRTPHTARRRYVLFGRRLLMLSCCRAGMWCVGVSETGENGSGCNRSDLQITVRISEYVRCSAIEWWCLFWFGAD